MQDFIVKSIWPFLTPVSKFIAKMNASFLIASSNGTVLDSALSIRTTMAANFDLYPLAVNTANMYYSLFI